MEELKNVLCQKVDVTVTSSQIFEDGSLAVVEENIKGSWYVVDSLTSVLAYDILIGGQHRAVTVRLSGDVLDVISIGEVHSRQTFAKEEWYASQYFISDGSLVCRHYTHRLASCVDVCGGTIILDYDLWSGECKLSRFIVAYVFSLHFLNKDCSDA